MAALTGLIDRDKSEDEKSAIDKIRSGGKLIVTINPHLKVSLTELIDFVADYHAKDLRDPKINGYRIENISDKDYRLVLEVGVPLQESRS